MRMRGVVAALAALLLVLAVIAFRKMSAPDLTRYEAYREPAIRVEPNRKVLVVEAIGAPDKTSKKAFGFLMRSYFGIKGVPMGGPKMAAPRARWPVADAVPRSQWVGRFAIPVPDSITDARLPQPPAGLSIGLTTWEYGQVAEILHVGPYSGEEADCNRLREFIKSSGYEIAGDHEEIYLKGPGMFFRGNPKHYYTIIRYRVKKAEAAKPDSATSAGGKLSEKPAV